MGCAAGNEELNLLSLREFCIATCQRHEAVAVIINCRGAVQKLELPPNGLSVMGSPKRVRTSLTKERHGGMPELSSRQIVPKL